MSDAGAPAAQADGPGFDDPFALLHAAHTAILDHCDRLDALVAAAGGDADAAGLRREARAIIDFFTRGGRLHHEDEEHDLFPLLARQSLKLADLVHALRREHRELGELWDTLETGLRQVPGAADPGALAAAAARFCELNREHVRRENLDFLPAAVHSLGREQVRDIGVAMAARRGVRFSG